MTVAPRARTGIYKRYDFQTYLHETGHALGLGHQGPYNGSATYGTNNIYTNDTWQWSIMSYFLQSNFGGASYDYVMRHRWLRISTLLNRFMGRLRPAPATTYGFHSNAGSIFDFNQYAGLEHARSLASCDSGGTDTIDASGYSINQTIDLIPGDWSSIGGYINNIGIWISTTIECDGGVAHKAIIQSPETVWTIDLGVTADANVHD